MQLAFAPAAGIAVGEATAATVRLGLTLYGWYLSRRQRDQHPVVAFKARDFQPEGEADTPQLAWVGNLTRDEVDDACPRHIDAQNITNEAAASTNRSDYRTPQEYGTAVHLKVRNAINGPNPKRPKDPNFRAEISLLKTLEETGKPEDQEASYGRPGSVRVDVLENTEDNTVCVYDIKTGTSGLSPARFAEISRTVYLRFPETQRIIVIEVRPGR